MKDSQKTARMERPSNIGEPQPGDVVEGKYTIVRELGRGAMGVVYLARQEALRRDVALKSISPEIFTEPGAKERFAREALLLARLRHGAIVTVHDLIDGPDAMYLIMDYVPGGDLESYRQSRGGGVFPAEEARALLEQLLGGLSHAHTAGVVHRDLKPANLLVDPAGILRIADFGIAFALPQSMARTVVSFQNAAGVDGSALEGTADYMSPEVKAGGVPDERSDLFAVGLIAYWLLTGHLPGPASLPLSRTLPGLGHSWDQWLAKALAPDPARRFSSATEMLASLRGLGGASRAPARRRQDLGPAPAQANSGQNRVVLWVSIITGLLLVIFTVARLQYFLGS